MKCGSCIAVVVILACVDLVFAQSESDTVSLEISIEADSDLAKKLNATRQADSVLLQDVFVFVPRIRSAVIRKSTRHPDARKVQDWLPKSDHATPRTPVDHRFEVQDGRIVPARKIVRTNDRVRCNLNSKEFVSLQMVVNSPYGGVLPDKDALYSFQSAEPVPVKIFDPVDKYAPAWALILDHDLAGVTDKNGTVTFSNLPAGVEIPFRLFLPSIAAGQKYEISSETVQTAGRRFVFYSDDGKPQKHKIRVRAGSGD